MVKFTRTRSQRINKKVIKSRKSRRCKKRRNTLKKRGGGVWDSIKNAFTQSEPTVVGEVPPPIPINVNNESAPSEVEHVNIESAPSEVEHVNNGGMRRRNTTKKSSMRN